MGQLSLSRIQSAYDIAKERYADLGVDTESALARLDAVSISLHCWQGDDLGGFENPGGELTAGSLSPELPRQGAQCRGAAPGSRSGLSSDSRLPSIESARNLWRIGQASRAQPDRAGHFSAWVDWAKANGHGLDFNPTCFSHPLAASGFTLSHPDPAVRRFWVEHCIASRRIGAYFGRQLGTPAVTNVWIPDGYKDMPADRGSPRRRLLESLDAILAEQIDPRLNLDAVEPKLFGLGSESYVTGSMEFYTATPSSAISC